MWANNETGVIFPVEKIAPVLRERDIVFHTDAVQAAGKLDVDVSKVPVDMLSLSGHKLHGPKGVGVLYVRKGTKFSPFLIGGHQEKGRRGGTENVASIVGLGKAAELAKAHRAELDTRVRALRDKLENGLLEKVSNTMLNGDPENRLPNTTSIAFEYVEGEAILLMMNELGICASSGSACTSGSLEPSHVLRAMGVPFTAAHGSIRFSLSCYNTDKDVDFVLENLPRSSKGSGKCRRSGPTGPRWPPPCAPSSSGRRGSQTIPVWLAMVSIGSFTWLCNRLSGGRRRRCRSA